MNLLLRNLRIYTDGTEIQGDLRISKSRITEIGNGLRTLPREECLNLSGYLALPGLINSHDHLEFNLFPRMGDPPYSNFYRWAEDIYYPDQSPVNEILQVSLRDRLLWGGYKNLVSGVTTVVHHNPYYRRVFRRNFPVRVLKDYSWAHSLGHGRNIESSFRAGRGMPFFIHAAEGTDAQSAEEITKLSEMGILAQNTVVVHGVALQFDQIKLISNCGVRFVWCPASNKYLFGKTLDVSQLVSGTLISLGTDSTMSGSKNLFDELRAAYETNYVTSAKLMKMVTTLAASVSGISDGRGRITTGGPADLVILPDDAGRTDQVLLKSRPRDLAMVLVAGEVCLASSWLARILGLDEATSWVDGERKWLTGDLMSLCSRIRNQVEESILKRNDIWQQFEPSEMNLKVGST